MVTALIRHLYRFAVTLSATRLLDRAVRSHRFVAAALYGVSFARDALLLYKLNGDFPFGLMSCSLSENPMQIEIICD